MLVRLRVPQTLSEIKTLLTSHGLTPRKMFGQNFLHDHHHIERIVEAAELDESDTVLEVGPGTGTLTGQLIASRARVVAVEIDRGLVPVLRELYGQDSDKSQLINDDVLASKRSLNTQIEDAVGGRTQPFKLIANLPYNVASPLLATLVTDWPGMELAIIMVQREVGDRLNASPGTKAYGPLGILVQALCEVDFVSTLPPSCFWPAPKVESAVIRVRRSATPMTDDIQGFSKFVHTVFEKRRKQLGSVLGRDFPFPDDIDPKIRAERLSVSDLVRLSERAS